MVKWPVHQPKNVLLQSGQMGPRLLDGDIPVQAARQARQRRRSTSRSLCSQWIALMYSSTGTPGPACTSRRGSHTRQAPSSLSPASWEALSPKKDLRNAASASARVYRSPIGNGLPCSVGRPQYKVLGGCRLPLSLLR